MKRSLDRTLGRMAILAVLAATLVAPTISTAAAPGLVVFGDSLSDPGNLFVLRQQNNTPPDYAVDASLVPDDAYARGGHHLTNGPTWVEEVGRLLGVDAGPALRGRNPQRANYAVAGARAQDDISPIGLGGQVRGFLAGAPAGAPPAAWYVIQIGGNDVRDALVAAAGGQDPGAIIGAAVAHTAQAMAALHQAGARRFLVLDVPAVALAPSVLALGPGAAVAADQITRGYNAALRQVLDVLQASLPDVQIVRFSLYEALTELHGDPARFGLTNVTDPCIHPIEPRFVCRNPDEYLFWDGIHPTRAVHAIVGRVVAQILMAN